MGNRKMDMRPKVQTMEIPTRVRGNTTPVIRLRPNARTNTITTSMTGTSVCISLIIYSFM